MRTRPATILPGIMDRLLPALTLRDLIGPDARFTGRASERRCRWLPRDPLVRDAIAGGTLIVCGDVPILTSEGSSTPRVRRLLERSGHSLPPRIETFRGAADFGSRLAEFSIEGGLLVQHVPPVDELPADRYLVPLATISWLNNKAHLGELVPARSVPRRHIVASGTLRNDLPRLPFVLKAVSDDSTGGGAAVAICRNRSDVEQALVRFEGIERLVLEELLEFGRSYCLSFATFADGTVRYLGAAEQICTPEGQYTGNWLDGTPLPDEAILPALEAMERAARRGYRGFSGADVAMTPQGPRVLDLNFRFNGSTAPVLLFDALRAARGPVVARVRRWYLDGAGWERAIERGLDQRRLVPIAIYDPEGGPHTGAAPFILAMTLGRDREDVDGYLRDAGT